MVPNACPELHFSIDGAGAFVAADNGDPTDWTPFHHSSRQAFNGLALAIVQGRPGYAGKATLTVRGQGLAPGAVNLVVAGALQLPTKPK